jgi:hypothetical protein
LRGSSVQHDNWKIEQTRNCGTALDGANQAITHQDVTIEFSTDANPQTVATTSAVFFTNPHVTLCGAINSCSLKLAGCSDPYTNANLVINTVTGTITAKKNVDDGYVDEVCVVCKNNDLSVIQQDSWTVTQNPNCETLSKITKAPKEFGYDD